MPNKKNKATEDKVIELNPKEEPKEIVVNLTLRENGGLHINTNLAPLGAIALMASAQQLLINDITEQE